MFLLKEMGEGRGGKCNKMRKMYRHLCAVSFGAAPSEETERKDTPSSSPSSSSSPQWSLNAIDWGPKGTHGQLWRNQPVVYILGVEEGERRDLIRQMSKKGERKADYSASPNCKRASGR